MNSKKIILEQLKACHNENHWFVSLNTAMAGLTKEQAKQHSGDPNNSVIGVVNHITYWSERILKRLKGEQVDKMIENNELTFSEIEQDWEKARARADKVLGELTEQVANMKDEKLNSLVREDASDIWEDLFIDFTIHNAYHVGQIVTLRKQFGTWDSSKGVS
jgi:uncharacterized damage-inducible protein DinB